MKRVEIYNIETDKMINGPNLAKGSYGSCAVKSELTNQVYIIGGAGGSWAETQVFDILGSTISLLPSQMAVGRTGPACMILEERGLIIAAGGANSTWKSTTSVEILDIRSETWHGAQALPNVGSVWAPRGQMFFWFSRTMYQYEPTSDEWMELEDVPFSLSDLSGRLIPMDAGVNKLCQFK